VPAGGRLGGGHGQQHYGLPAGTGIRDQTWHAGQATRPARQAHPLPRTGAKPQAVPNAAENGGIALAPPPAPQRLAQGNLH
jgi:hypothetical protein